MAELLDVRTVARNRRELPTPQLRRAIREDAGLSLRQMASALGVSSSAVALWEAGERHPRPAHLAAYVALLRDLRDDG